MSSDAAVTLAVRLADRLPDHDIHALAMAVAGGVDGLAAGRLRAASGLLRAAYDDVFGLLSLGCAADLLAGCLLGAAAGVAAQRHRQPVDVVWTGPESTVRTGRLTSAVVVDLIEAAHQEVLIVSYATHSESSVARALSTAVARGVDVTLLLERAFDNPKFVSSPTPFPELVARRLSWPLGLRPAGASMHAKVLVVDREVALVGSANLTGYAMTANLECGVLIRDAEVPRRIHAHVMSLVERGDLAIIREHDDRTSRTPRPRR